MRLVASAPSTDAELWAALRDEASESAFSELFDRYADAVYNYCFRHLGQWSAAEEATQETFIALWQRVLRGRIDALTCDTAAGLILWQARQVVADTRRAASRRLRLVKAVEATVSAQHEPIDQWVETETTQQQINAAMESLPRDQRDVVELVCWAELSLADAAAALGVPVGTVKSRLSRARQSLRDNAAELMGEAS